jgi:hypothetical protein
MSTYSVETGTIRSDCSMPGEEASLTFTWEPAPPRHGEEKPEAIRIVSVTGSWDVVALRDLTAKLGIVSLVLEDGSDADAALRALRDLGIVVDG